MFYMFISLSLNKQLLEADTILKYLTLKEKQKFKSYTEIQHFFKKL